MQDDPRVDLQCSETLHGDEPEAVWRLHPTIQGREKQVSDNYAVKNLSLAAQPQLSWFITVTNVIENVVQTSLELEKMITQASNLEM